MKIINNAAHGVSDVATTVFQPVEKAVVQPIAQAATSIFQPVGVAIGVDKPPTPTPAPAAPVSATAAPAAPAMTEESGRSDPTSSKAKLGRMKSRGSLLIDATNPVIGAANGASGSLNIPN